MKRHLTSSIAISIALTSASAAFAEDVRYFTSGEMTCRGRDVALEMRYAPNSDSALTIMWRHDRHGFNGLEWSLPAMTRTDPLMLRGIARLDQAELTGLATDAPELRFFDRRSPPNPLDDCPVLQLRAVADPMTRYAETLALLNVENPTPSDVLTARAAIDRLPPPQFLPSLDQQAIPAELDQGIGEMEQAMLERVEDRLLDLGGDESGALVGEFRDYWLDHRGPESTNLMLRLQRGRAVSQMLSNGPQDSPNAGAVFCHALAGNPGYLPEADYLELMFGLPLAFWSRSDAETMMANARACGDEQFEKSVSRTWAHIESRIASLDLLRDEIARLAAVDRSLESFSAAQWLTSNRSALTAAGVHARDLDDVLDVARDRIVEAALPDLASELAAPLANKEINQAFVDHCSVAMRDLTMSEMIAAPSELSAQDEQDAVGVRRRIEDACETQAAAQLAERGTAQLEADRRAALAADATGEGARATNGFGSSIDYNNLHSMHPLEPVVEALRIKAAALSTETAAKRAEAVAAESSALADRFASGLDGTAGTIDCAADYAWSADLLAQCEDGTREANARAAERACDAKFDAVDAPESLRAARLQFGLYGGGTLREALCGSHEDFSLERRGGGLFSSEAFWLHIRLPQGRMFSAELVEPEDGDIWRWTNADVEPGTVREGYDLNEPSVMAHCVNNLHECLE